MIKIQRPYPVHQLKFVAGTGGVKKGQLVTWSSNTVIAATEGIASAIIVGVALEDADAAAYVMVDPITGGEVLEMDVYTGGATDTIADSNLGTLYDIYVDGSTGEMTLDLNDTTGAFVLPVGRTSDGTKAFCKLLAAHAYLA